jgi:hypothetical protein
MKDLICISAYCPTEEQEIILERCVDSVRRYGFHIVLISHSHIPIHIQKKCHYYLYDYNNDISDNPNLLGFSYYTFDNKKIVSKFFSKTFYGFAIYRMLSMAAQIALNFGYENMHHMEYDCELLDKDLIIKNSKLLDEYDTIFYTKDGKDPEESGFILGCFKSFKVKSLPDNFKKYNRDFIENEMHSFQLLYLENFTKKLFIESGNKIFFSELPSKDLLKIGDQLYHRNLHWTLYYNDEDKNLNIFYREIGNTPEKISIIVNRERIVNIQTSPGVWNIRSLGIFDEIHHVRVDNDKKIVYEKLFDSESREKFKMLSFIL